MRAEITVFNKLGGPLTKRIELDASGKLKNDSTACLMSSGTARRTPVDCAEQLGTLIGGLKSDQAIALGRLRPGLPDKVSVVTKRSLNGSTPPNVIARTGANIVHRPGEPGFALLDYDEKGMPGQVAERITAAGGLWEALASVLPALAGAPRVRRASTSAGLLNQKTGASIPGSNGLHLFIGLKDASDSVRFLTTLHERCWLAGYGWMMVGAGGQLLERSIIDRMVGQPERLVFEGAPVLVPPLAQDTKARKPQSTEGAHIDSRLVCPPLTVVEKAALNELRARAAHALAGQSAKARDEFIDRQASEIAKRTGMSERRARDTIIRQCNGLLLPSVVLPFDDPELSGKTVADVLANPAAFEGETLADPLEGVEYGACKAKIMRRANGEPWINSFAHGRTTYELKLDAAAIRDAMAKADAGDVVAVLIELLLQSAVDSAEEEALIAYAKQRSSVGVRAIMRQLKAARGARDGEKRKRERDRHLAERNDPRPMLELPNKDAPFLPVMGNANDVLGATKDRVPPSRNIEGDLICAPRNQIPGMHAFQDANEHSGGGDAVQAPAQMVIKVMSEAEAAELIERYIDFVDKDGTSVHLQGQFVKHYMNRNDGALPTVVAIATLPMVSADGRLIYADGLDRKRGIIFDVQPEIMKLVPSPGECRTAQAVGAAMNFLTDEWLVDVAADYAGKCLIIALAMTIIQRTLLDDRPTFFITAGRRGGGKTTVLKMITQAITGTPAAAAAWSPNEEERRKALMSYLLWGAPYILWDNIPRGLQIACPHIERSCTSSFYADRKLCASEIVQAAASAIHLFTGNNIGPKGDLASRSLQVRLSVDRIDPENRPFKHPHPVEWTQANRGKILQALYTILLGNPALRLARDADLGTRFKRWYRMVGIAVEHAAQCAAEINPDVDEVPDQILNIQSLFLAQEADDEDSADLADCLNALAKMCVSSLTANDVCHQLNTLQTENTAIVREFLFPAAPLDYKPTPKTVSKRLSARLDEPVRYGDTVLTLRSSKDSHTKALHFRVEAKKP